MSQNRGQKTDQFKGPYKPIGEVHLCHILANRAIIAGILHRNRKGEYFEVFRYCLRNEMSKRSPIWAYFPSIGEVRKRGEYEEVKPGQEKRGIFP
jgi:hypothetical protein